MAKLVIRFKKFLRWIYLPRSIGIDTTEHDYDWRELPLSLRIADLIFYSFIPGYKGEAVKDISEEMRHNYRRTEQI